MVVEHVLKHIQLSRNSLELAKRELALSIVVSETSNTPIAASSRPTAWIFSATFSLPKFSDEPPWGLS
jgi:hypothetical protein